MNEREEAIQRAKKWWKGKEDPIYAPLGTYICDSCGDAITEKKGTSRVGTWTRCARCTDRLFAVQKLPTSVRSSTRTTATQFKSSSKPSATLKQSSLQSCKKCSESYDKGKMTCPHCGNTKWGLILIAIFFGPGFLLLGIRIGILGGWFGAVIFGGLGSLIILCDLFWIIEAIKIRKTMKSVSQFKSSPKSSTTKEQKNEYNLDPRHTKNISHNGCLLCQNQNQLNLASFYYGSFERKSELKNLVRETKTMSQVLGHKSYYFCDNCIDKMVNVRKKRKNKYAIKWIIGTLLWFFLLIASALLESSTLIIGILITGVILTFWYFPRILKNKREWIALSQKGGKTMFEDFLDKEAIKIFRNDKKNIALTAAAFWTRSEYLSFTK